MKPKVPMQPIVRDDRGVVRFRANAIVRRLSNEGKISLNEIAAWDMPVEDAEQFWQMLGYSVSGYGDLSFVRPETLAAADADAEALFAVSRGSPLSAWGRRRVTFTASLTVGLLVLLLVAGVGLFCVLAAKGFQ